MGMDGWPIFPRLRSPFVRSPSLSRERTITDAACADKPVSRAISALGKAPFLRSVVKTSLSLCSLIPLDSMKSVLQRQLIWKFECRSSFFEFSLPYQIINLTKGMTVSINKSQRFIY